MNTTKLLPLLLCAALAACSEPQSAPPATPTAEAPVASASPAAPPAASAPSPTAAASDDSPATPPPAAAASAAPSGPWKVGQIVGEDVNGLTPLPLAADVPPDAQQMGGTTGFYTEDDRLNVTIRAASKTATSMDAEQASISSMPIKSWVSSKPTKDGWELRWILPGFDDNFKPNGDRYAFSVHRVIAGKKYECSGSLKNQANLEMNLKVCASLRPAKKAAK